MGIQATRPPSPEDALRYRSAGYWRPAHTGEDYLGSIASGGERLALVDQENRWSYRDLADVVGTISAVLTRAGAGAGDAVLLLAPLHNVAAAAYLAVRHVGAVAVMLDRRCGAADLRNAYVAAQPRLTLAFDADARRLRVPTSPMLVSLDTILDADGGNDRRERLLDPDLPVVVLFTSGTTSAPKGVIHTGNSLRCGVANMTAALEFESSDGFFLSSPLAGITGVLQLETAIAGHGKVILEDRFEPGPSLQRIREQGATLLGGAPVIAESLFAQARREAATALPLRSIAVGGAVIPQSVLDGADEFGLQPVRVYGSSEAPFSTSSGLHADLPLRDDGVPLPGVEIRLRGGSPQAELLVRGPHQFHGYLDSADNTDAFADGWVRTGDEAEIIDGRLRITGRLKDVAARKGMKISLAEIDSAAAGLGDSASLAVPDDDTGERICLAVYPKPGQEISYESVIGHLTSVGLAKWKLPEQIVVWDRALPRTESGKVVRQRIRDDGTDLDCIYAPRLAQRARTPQQQEP